MLISWVGEYLAFLHAVKALPRLTTTFTYMRQIQQCSLLYRCQHRGNDAVQLRGHRAQYIYWGQGQDDNTTIPDDTRHIGKQPSFLRIFMSGMGYDHPDTLEVLADLASLYHEQKNGKRWKSGRQEGDPSETTMTARWRHHSMPQDRNIHGQMHSLPSNPSPRRSIGLLNFRFHFTPTTFIAPLGHLLILSWSNSYLSSSRSPF